MFAKKAKGIDNGNTMEYSIKKKKKKYILHATQ